MKKDRNDKLKEEREGNREVKNRRETVVDDEDNKERHRERKMSDKKTQRRGRMNVCSRKTENSLRANAMASIER